MTTIYAATAWPSNAEMIADCARLGYLHADWRTLDPTFGEGVFWKLFRPLDLVTHDLAHDGVDVRALPYADREFRAVVFDPPYKLNGTPSAPDERYGVHVRANRESRLALIRDGTIECARVCNEMLLVKCQDQVEGGKVRWQSRMVADAGEAHGFRLVQMLHKLNRPRPQPAGRRQVHAQQNYSTMLVLRREASRSRKRTA